MSYWKLNIPSTIYCISIGLRKSRWCNHTKRLRDGDRTVWKWDYMKILGIWNYQIIIDQLCYHVKWMLEWIIVCITIYSKKSMWDDYIFCDSKPLFAFLWAPSCMTFINSPKNVKKGFFNSDIAHSPKYGVIFHEFCM